MFHTKVILITGASSGIGEATARALDAQGAFTILVSRRKEKLDVIAAGLQHAWVCPADLSDPAEVKSVIERTMTKYGRIDVLINNAASIIVAPSESVTIADLQRAFSTNLIAPVVATQAVIRHMHKKGGAHIINIGSPGFMMGIPYYSPYVCSKAAFSAWTRTIQAEFAGTDVIISEYFPGYIKTDSLPESRVGEVEQDLLMSPKQNFLTRKFAKPRSADDVARQLVKLVQHPKTLVYSGAGVKIGAFISNISSFRLSIARQMAETARKKINLSLNLKTKK